MMTSGLTKHFVQGTLPCHGTTTTNSTTTKLLKLLLFNCFFLIYETVFPLYQLFSVFSKIFRRRPIIHDITHCIYNFVCMNNTVELVKHIFNKFSNIF